MSREVERCFMSTTEEKMSLQMVHVKEAERAVAKKEKEERFQTKVDRDQLQKKQYKMFKSPKDISRLITKVAESLQVYFSSCVIYGYPSIIVGKLHAQYQL